MLRLPERSEVGLKRTRLASRQAERVPLRWRMPLADCARQPVRRWDQQTLWDGRGGQLAAAGGTATQIALL